MKFSRKVFIGAALYGFAVLVPSYFLESLIGRNDPPPVTHPEYFYGFLGVALAWQILFFMIGLNPARYRPLMPVAFLEKLGFGAPAIVLYLAHRIQPAVLTLGLIDLFLGALFMSAYVVSGKTAEVTGAKPSAIGERHSL